MSNPTTLLTDSNIAANTESSRSTSISNISDGIKAIDVTVEIAFGGSADAACLLRMYSSTDNTNWDTVAVDSFSIPVDVGGTVRVTRRLTPIGNYISFTLFNTSSSQAAGGAWSIAATLRTDQLN